MHQAVSTVAAELLCGVTAPPTDLDAVARKVNVACFLGDDIAGSGELRRGDAGLIIVYSNYLSKARQRFTIAHEIAHAYFESNWVDLSQSSKEIEQLCDMIAAEILMPTPAVSERIKGGLSIEMILEVARSFRVSMSAAAIRCSELKRATVFEANERSVTWGCGFVRKGRVNRLNPALQLVIQNALRGQSGEEDLLLDSDIGLRPWRAEYRRTGDGRALLLIRPSRESLKAASA